MAIDISQFSAIFFDETEELLADLEKLLLTVNTEQPDPEDINAIFRIAHSIKGGAATFGFTDLIEITHILESMLDKIRQGEAAFTAQHQEILLQSRDVLKMQVDGLRWQAPVDQEKVADIRMVLESMIDSDHILPPPATVVVSSNALAVAEEPYQRCFRIEFPSMSDDSREALSTELALLGQLEFEERQPGAKHDVLLLATHDSADDILALCSFVLDPETVKIMSIEDVNTDPVAVAPPLVEDDSFGLFDAPPPVVVPVAIPPIPETLPPAPPLPLKPLSEPTTQTLKATPAKANPLDKTALNVESSTIRVSVEKVDQLINLVGELVITHAMIAKRAEVIDQVLHEKLLNGIAQLGQNSRDLQETAMSMRMMPMEVVFSRFPRMVRELSVKLGKQINLVTQGNSIELDKGLIEKIVDPLTHLVRNSIDHGIELPANRLEKGKPEIGRLVLSAVHQGGNVVIEVMDDGNGLNRDKILKKAQAEGIPVKDNLSDEDVWQLIFAPGFSTADTVTDVSGRGVGMDVVKRNIIQLGGTVNVQSMSGIGTTVTVSLPLTLAILDGMSVKVGEETYILPLNFVVESFQPAQENIKELTDQGQVIFVRGEYLPIVPLHDVFAVQPRSADPLHGILVVIASEDRKAAVWVDELLGQQQIVVKNIESNYRKVANVSGATIMGDGTGSLIIDVSDLLRSRYTKTGQLIA